MCVCSKSYVTLILMACEIPHPLYPKNVNKSTTTESTAWFIHMRAHVRVWRVVFGVWCACLHSHDRQEETIEKQFKILLLHGLIKVSL